MSADSNKELARAYLKCVEAGDVAGATGKMSDDVTVWIPGLGTMDKAGLGKLLGHARSAFSEGMTLSVIGETANAERAVIQCKGHAPLKKGGSYDNDYCFAFTIRGNKIVDLMEYTDSAPAKAAFGP